MDNAILPMLIEKGSELAILVITLLFALLTKVVHERLKSGAAKDAALELVSAAETVVRNVDQTLRPELVEAAKDGKLSEDDFAALKRAALPQLKDQLSEQALKTITSNSERLEAVLSRAIESAVSKKKETAVMKMFPLDEPGEEVTQ